MAHYRKTYLCICEGQQEKMYLDHVAGLIKKFPQKVVKFNSYVDSPYRLTKTYEDYDSAALFDFDFNEVKFKRNICVKLKSQNDKKDRLVCHAYSNVNFDLWLIIHKEDYIKEVISNDAYISDVRRIYSLSPKGNIKNETTINKILSQITLKDVKMAIERAEKLRKEQVKTDGFIIGKSTMYTNPDFSIHEFLKMVLKNSGDL